MLKVLQRQKNVYLIRPSKSGYEKYFKNCPETPLEVVTLNHELVANPKSPHHISEKRFPTQGAQTMIAQYNMLYPHVGKFAGIIIEYLDKDTEEPVAYLFPTHALVVDNYRDRMRANLLADFEYKRAQRADIVLPWLEILKKQK